VAGLSKKFAITFIFWLIGLLPRNQKLVIFESFAGKQYSCNPRAIYEYMRDNNPEYTLLWSVDKKHTASFDQHEVPYITRFSFQWFFKLGRAKYWIWNTRLPLELPKPKQTIYVQTWHGTPLKKIGLDIENVRIPGQTTKRYRAEVIRESRKWDYLISPNPYASEIFRTAFAFEGTMIESGYPRNDILFDPEKERIASGVRERLGIPTNKKVILYAPTWRDNEFHEPGKYKFDLKFDVNKMQRRFGDSAVLLVRMHYLVAEQFDFHGDFVKDVSSYEDIRDLYLISDVLVTDYSSVFFDYANLYRPIIFFTYDLAEYRDRLRGFYFDIEKHPPGPLVKTSNAFLEQLDAFLENPSAIETNNSFFETFSMWEDGHAAKETVQTVFEK
jgi:CDP-glycerol glycerophosphotransferase